MLAMPRPHLHGRAKTQENAAKSSQPCKTGYFKTRRKHRNLNQLRVNHRRLAEDQRAVLITTDGDFKRIAPRIPDGQKTRFRKLSRIWLRCREYHSADRLEKAFSFIEAEFEISQKGRDKRMILQIGHEYIRSDR
jgi:hypothetical protein